MTGIFRVGPRPVINVMGGIRVQTSLQGMPIPIVYGRTRIAGNLVWYGDFIAKPATGGKKGYTGGGGSGKKGGGEFDYGAAIIIGLCNGPISRLGQIWSTQGNLSVNETSETYTVPPGGGGYTATQEPTYLYDMGVTRGDAYTVTANDYGAPSSITLTGVQQTPMIQGGSGAGHYTRSGPNGATYNFDPADAGKVMTITYTYAPPITGGGIPQDPITTAGFTFFNGAIGQAVWSYITSNHPSQAIGYSGLAYVATPQFDLGMSGTLPNLSFEVYGLLPFGSGAGDANPSDVLYDLLTNSIYGCGIDPSLIGSMTQYSNYCLANGLLISPAIDQVRTAADWVKEILDATNSEIIETGGQLVVVPYGDTTVVANGVTFTPATQPIYDLTADDFMRTGPGGAVQVERPTVQDAFNSVRVEFLDRGNSYNPSIVESQDLNAIDAYKYRPEGTRQYHMFTSQAPAAKAAATALARLVYIRNKFKFKVAQKYVLLDAMDLVTVTVPELGFSKKPVRILSISEQPDRTLDIEAEEFPWGCSGPTLYPKQTQTPGGPNAYAPPGSVNAPIMFEALSRLNNQIGHTVWFGLSGQSADWGGCRIWMSDDGVTYQQVATAVGATKMGALTAVLPPHADPDSADTLSVDLTESFGILDSVTSAQADLFASLCYVDGELISYEDATLTAAFKYSLGTKLRRGVYNSTIGSHAIGSKFMLLDGSVEGWNYDVGLIGKTVHFKFTSFNRSGLVEENIADVTDYPFSITGACIGLLTPAHSSYRPTSNPLTATDAGTSATINIAPFSMRVPGQPDIPFGSGAIVGLSYSTLYFVYFDDPGFVPMTPAYQASNVREDALNAGGRFFVGSILTPAAGAPDSSGNNDGGAGAQLGSATSFTFAATSQQVLGNGAVANAAEAIDGDFSTYAALTASGDTGTNQAFLNLINPPPIALPSNKTVTLYVKRKVTNTLNGSGTVGRISLINLTTHTDIADLETYAPGVGAPVGIISLVVTPAMIPFLANSQIQVEAAITTSSPQSSGAIEIDVYQAWVTIT